jgi:hypothetical protein
VITIANPSPYVASPESGRGRAGELNVDYANQYCCKEK